MYYILVSHPGITRRELRLKEFKFLCNRYAGNDKRVVMKHADFPVREMQRMLPSIE